MEGLTLAAGAQAFGDGTHPSTRGVLAALSALDPVQFTPRIACDIGAGSGIVTFAMQQRFHCPVVAVDVARSAIETLEDNARANAIALAEDGRSPLAAGQVLALQADGFAHPAMAAQAPFDLIAMNILAEPLLALAAEAERHLASGGALILSGMLRWQDAALEAAYAALGLELTARLTLGDWVTQLWQKP